MTETLTKRPSGLSWRSSSWFITSVVTLGTTTDLLTHTIVVPIVPYRLEALGYSDVSSLTSWLLVAYSGGMAVLTPFLGYYFHLVPWRRGPMLVSILLMQVALVLFMLCKPFWAMVVARVILGASSAVVWSVGFVMLVENVDEKNVGRQLGFATAGLSIGTTIGPPIGGALYDAMGWYAPFILCIIVCSLDFVGRLLVVERKEAEKWLGEPCPELALAMAVTSPLKVEGLTECDWVETPTSQASPAEEKDAQLWFESVSIIGKLRPVGTADSSEVTLHDAQVGLAVAPAKQLSPFAVIAKLCSAPRGISSLAVSAAVSLVIGLQEPIVTVHVKETWGKDSHFVGLMYLAGALPTALISPLAGELADRFGAEWILLPGLLFALPWMALLTLDKSLPGFTVFFAVSTVALSIMAAPIGLELAMTAKTQEGISEMHQFAAMNLAFAIFATLGPILGGQLYDRVDEGFSISCWVMFGIVALPLVPVFCNTGNRPWLARLTRKQNA